MFSTAFWPLGFAASFMFFLCGLRLNHEAIHGNLGLSRQGDHLVLHGLSFLMGASNHAVAHGHLVHHKNSMGPLDFEGRCGHMSLRQVLTYGPRFPYDVNRAAWVTAKPRAKRRIAVDFALNGLLILLAVISGFTFLFFHIAAIAMAQCLTALFAVWITHQGTQHNGLAARSQRGFLARVAYLMFYHREHHLFPKVPVHHLPELAQHLDETVPDYAAKRMPVVPFLERKVPCPK